MIGNTWKRLHLDFVGPVERTIEGNEYILTIIDAFSKFSFAYAVKNCDAKTVIDKLQEVFLLVGRPEEIYTDNGKHFTANIIEEMCEIYDLKHKYTSPYNPQANGVCERFNATICDVISTIVNNNIKDWDKYINLAVSVYNSKKQSTTGISPYEVVFGETPRLKLDAMINSSKENIFMSDFIKEKYERMQKNEILVRKRLENNAKKTKVKNDIKFQVNDKVLLKIFKRGEAESRKKFSNRFHGPFIIKEIVSGVATLIEEEGGKEYGKMKLNNLKKFYEETEEEKEFRNKRKNEKLENEEFYEQVDEEYEDEMEEKHEENSNSIRRSKRNRKRTKHEGMIDLAWLEMDDYFVKKN